MAVGYASNTLGTVNDLALARKLSRAVGAWLLVDAVHAAPHFSMDVAALDTDFLLCSAYKWYGPHMGVLYARPGLLDTLPTDRLRTQDQSAPFRIETGTLHHAAMAGVRAAVHFLAGFSEGATLRERLVATMTALERQERALAQSYYQRVQAIPGVSAWGRTSRPPTGRPRFPLPCATSTPRQWPASWASSGCWSGTVISTRSGPWRRWGWKPRAAWCGPGRPCTPRRRMSSAC